MSFRILCPGSYFRSILIIVLFWFNISFAQKETQTSELERLNRIFSRQLQESRPQLYYDLLTSTDSAQIRLNSDPDIQLMYINDRGMPVYYTVENLNAARTLSTDDVWPGGSGGFSLTGSGTVVGKLGIWDGGAVLAAHQELSGRVTQIDSPGGTHYHATHVAGTMIASGVQSAAKGMSYQANLTAYDWNNDNSEMSSAAASGMNISNHSYGFITGWYYSGSWYWYGDIGISTTEDYGFGFYSGDARAWDQIAYNAPYYTIVKSAGNDRNDAGPGPGEGHYVWDGGWIWSTDTRDPDGGADGYDCISYAGTAKNIITVGAVDDITGGYSAPGDVVMSSFSGWGPVDDGRIKPDVVANGISLYSSMDDSNSAYDYLSGTSMSAPNLSGSLNLLVRYYEATHAGTTPRSSTMKAIIIQTADEAGPNSGPDYMFGWGLMNTLRAAQLIELDSTSTGIILEDSLLNSEVRQYELTGDGTKPIRITLVWTDPAGTPPMPSLNPTTLMMVNDLDLRLEYIGTGTIYYPYILNPSAPANPAVTGDNIRDNIEQIYIDLPSAGTYRLSVSHKGTLGAPQYYSLAGSVNLQIPTSGSPPVALCTNIIATADSSCRAGASVDNGSYDPDGDPITLVQIPAGPYPLGQTPVYLIVTDSSGLADTCQGTVTVNDNTPPVLTCPADTSVSNDAGLCSAVVSFTAIAIDNCSGVTTVSNPPSGSAFPVGTTRVEVAAADSSGNADTCYFNMIVTDTESPLAFCPSDTIVYVGFNQDSVSVMFEPGAEDNCDSVTVISSPPSNSWFVVGTTMVEVMASDGAGNADTCYFNVTVEQNPMPIPTLSEWGMIIFSLLLLTVGTIAIIRRRNIHTVSEPS
ncbi:MAG: IPTL-CTERM sorting domain-containing protein [Candidatus Zixiibacteriota bacterium]|nr:MAG: IPTL-CTERM sorting domain-containing protein [candidate division Zixibacteria bacterium]